jgi:hypothetical protein
MNISTIGVSRIYAYYGGFEIFSRILIFLMDKLTLMFQLNKKRYKDDIAMTCHETATALFEIGAINEAIMREFDEDCLVPDTSPSPESVKRGRVKPEPAHT